MSETEIETQGQKPKISKVGIVKIFATVSVFLLIICILWPGLIRLREYRHRNRIRCAENLMMLGKTMIIYACDYDDKYPTADKWCDLLIEYTDVTKKQFRCPGNRKERCSYAINPNVSAVTHPDMVVLFETKGGWNQFGGPEILTLENHEGQGCNILFNDGTVRFVKPEETLGFVKPVELGALKWKDEQQQ